tara:strand:- start:1158 stop:1652 length:495 start_codon:yes stop_codon:yes gene_type:complete
MDKKIALLRKANTLASRVMGRVAVDQENYGSENSGLVLSRRINESVVLTGFYAEYGDELPPVTVLVVDLGQGQAKLLVEAHDEFDIVRYDAKKRRGVRHREDRVTSLGLSIKEDKDGFFLSNVYGKNGRAISCGIHASSIDRSSVKLKFVADYDVTIVRDELIS